MKATKHASPLARCLLILWLAGSAISCSSRQTKPPEQTQGAQVAELLAQADRLYAQRETFDRAREAVSVLRHARTVDYSNYETEWKLAKFNYYLGTYGTDEAARGEAFREGMEAGEAAVKIEPNKPEGHFWLGANMGGRAELEGALAGLSFVGDIRREMETVIKLDEGFEGGSAYMALGQLDLELPSMLGGDNKRAVEELEKGLRFGENNVLLRLRLAEAYLSVKRRDDARQQLNAMLKMKSNPDYIPEQQSALAKARRLLEKL
ncbi:MAG: TRAP transporter TatT component family protein [Acidobacteria bacterium]|nr:TRAP transporter TatT component family protein [Acidobacteriota bacterium]